MRRLFFIPQERRVRDKDLDKAIYRELIELRKDLRQMNQQIEQAFSDLNTRVAAIESSEAAATALLVGLNEQLQAALNSSEDPTEVVNSIQAISDRLNTDAQNLAAAVAANTPATGGEATDPTSGDDTTGTEGDATDPTQG